MGSKRDYLLIVFCLLLMAVTNCTVQDFRLMIPQEKPVVERCVKSIRTHISDARYLTTVPEIELEEEPIEEPIEEPAEEIDEEPVYYEEEYVEDTGEESVAYLGEYRITAYEWTGNPCANGNYPTEYYTVACNDLPLGSVVWIDGVGYRTVEDRGGGGSGWLDLYLGDVSACYEWGVQYRDVYLVE